MLSAPGDQMYQGRQVGVDLLADAFPEMETDQGRSWASDVQTPNWVPLAEGSRRIPAEFREDPIGAIEPDLEHLLRQDDCRRALEEFETSDRDVLAWYAPYSLHGPRAWGIYFNDPMIDLVVARTALEMIPRTPDVRLGDVGMMAYRVIRAHELFHFAVEAASAVMSIDLKQDCYRPTFWSATRIELEEKLATAVEMGTPQGWKDRPNWPPKEVRRAFEESWEKIPRTYPYNDWQSCAGSMPARLDELTFELGGRQLGQLVALAYDAAPSKATPTRLAEWHTPFRAMNSMALSTLRRPSLSLVMRHARRSVKRGRPPGATLEARSGGDHPVKLKAPGKQTVPIPVKHDRMNDRVVTELAGFFGITKTAYLDELRAF